MPSNPRGILLCHLLGRRENDDTHRVAPVFGTAAPIGGGELSWEAPRMRRTLHRKRPRERKREARAMRVGTVQGARRKQRTLHWQRAASRLLAVPR